MGNFIVDGRRIFIPRTVVGGVPSVTDWTTYSNTMTEIFEISAPTAGFDTQRFDMIQYDSTRMIAVYSDNTADNLHAVVLTVSSGPTTVTPSQDTILSALSSAAGGVSKVKISPVNGTQFLVTVTNGSDLFISTIVSFDGTTLTANSNSVTHSGSGVANGEESSIAMVDSTTGVEIYTGSASNLIRAISFDLVLGATPATDSFSLSYNGSAVTLKTQSTIRVMRDIDVLDDNTLFVPVVSRNAAVPRTFNFLVNLDPSTREVLNNFVEEEVIVPARFLTDNYNNTLVSVNGSPSEYNVGIVGKLDSFSTNGYRAIAHTFTKGSSSVSTDVNTIAAGTVGTGDDNLCALVNVEQSNQLVGIYADGGASVCYIGVFDYDPVALELTLDTSFSPSIPGSNTFDNGHNQIAKAIEYQPGKIIFACRANNASNQNIFGAVVFEL